MTISIQHTLILPTDDTGLRLDQALAKHFPQYSRARLQDWIRTRQITMNDKPCLAKYKVKGGESILIAATQEIQTAAAPQEIALDIIDEDDTLIVINKPPGMVVHPAAGHHEGTLVNALLHHCPALEHLSRAGLIHRLDKDTSGLLVIAKTLEAHTQLVQQLQQRHIHRQYLALVNGRLISGDTVNAPIGRHPTARKKMAVVENGKPAVTHYRILEKFPAHTLLQVILETGRTHQIRVHLSYLHYPIVGDQTYGGRFKPPAGASPTLLAAFTTFKRQALHAEALKLTHPKTGKPVAWQAKMPDDMNHLLMLLREEIQDA